VETSPHLGLAGGTNTVLVPGSATAGRYCLVEMRIPPGGGPGPHRHDFEELFVVLEGAVDVTFRGEVTTVRAGQSVNVPANAPHFFRNSSGSPARMLCVCTPAGQEEFFAAVGDPLDRATDRAPRLEGKRLRQQLATMAELAPRYRNELLAP
jgi:mannose-6-phosphate isomerase-like protein (cupin superfamily)